MQFGAPSVSQKGSRSGQLLFVLQERIVSDNGASLFDILRPGSGVQQIYRLIQEGYVPVEEIHFSVYSRILIIIF